VVLVLLALQELVVLQLQTALLSWEARGSGHAAKAAAFDHLLALLEIDPVSQAAQASHQLVPAEAQHILSVLSTTQQLVAAPSKVELLLGLLAAQQPSIFRAAGQGERAAVLDPLLACLHLQHVTRTLLQPDGWGYAMHWAAAYFAVSQLSILRLLGADLDLAAEAPTGEEVTPLLIACTADSNPQYRGLDPWVQQLTSFGEERSRVS
jgi:hypothetical protein